MICNFSDNRIRISHIPEVNDSTSLQSPLSPSIIDGALTAVIRGISQTLELDPGFLSVDPDAPDAPEDIVSLLHCLLILICAYCIYVFMHIAF